MKAGRTAARRGLPLLFLAAAVEAFLRPSVGVVTPRTTTGAVTRPQQQQSLLLPSSWTQNLPPARSFSRRSSGALQQAAADATVDTTTTTDDYDYTCDVLVLGSGPAARSVASLLSAGSASLQVILADANEARDWPPNYGVWQDEWQAILERYDAMGVSLADNQNNQCVDRTWNVTDCYFGGSFKIPTERRLRVDRPYYRIDRFALRRALQGDNDSSSDSPTYTTVAANHVSAATSVNLYAPVGSLQHDATGTTARLETADGTALAVRTQLVVDCTGHETKLVLRDTRDVSPAPGFQIAYGILCDVDAASFSSSSSGTNIGPYDSEAMTLFDYRTDHYDNASAEEQKRVADSPTFMYAMPLKDNQIFFEETSLVARPAMSFQDCKDRCYTRLEHLGITVTKVYEEEFCYIPMGGALPAKDQRVIGLGGAAAMVHPSTGYHLCRCLLGAADVATTILRELDPANLGDAPPNLDRVAALSYDALWSPETIRQRNFAVFGGEYLMKQNVVGLRGFFDGFFQLPLPLWAGFLAGWPGLPNNDKHESWLARLWFGLVFVSKLPLSVAVDMFTSIVTYSLATGAPLIQSVTPLLGQPASYADAAAAVEQGPVGDVAAKEEARQMLTASKVEKVVPVAFVAPTTTSETATATKKAATTSVVAAAISVEESSVTEDVAADEEPEASDDEPQLIEIS